MPVPSVDDVQVYIEHVEHYVTSSVTSVANGIPNVGDAVKRLWADVSRFGPKLPEIHLPSLGDFEVPPPPPPPPPPKSLLSRSADWVTDHPWIAAGVGVGVVGATLLVGYSGIMPMHGRRKAYKHKVHHERRQVVVVLGGDTPLALALIQGLEKKGFIVIASAATSEAASDLESKCNGYVRGLVLDPLLPDSVPNFLRLLLSSLSRRFPIDAPGDPHASPASLPYVHSVVSLLSLSSSALPPPAPLEHINLTDDYLAYLNTTHITPLMVIQALLPLLRSPSPLNGRGKKKPIILCVPAIDARVGLPFAAARAMSAAATARGAEVLRREIRAAAATGASPAMNDIKIIVMDVGAIESPAPSRRRMITYDASGDMDVWTDSEKRAYGPAYLATIDSDSEDASARRRPSHPSVFVNSVIEVVTYGQKWSVPIFGYRLPLSYTTRWLMGLRYPVGAGAFTYTLATFLPHSILDVILNLPYRLISARNSLLPGRRNAAATNVPAPQMPPATPAAAPPKPNAPTPAPAAESASDPESDVGSDADVESNASSGEHSGVVGGSWVSLGTGSTTNPWKP